MLKKGMVLAVVKDQSVWIVYPTCFPGYMKSGLFSFNNSHNISRFYASPTLLAGEAL